MLRRVGKMAIGSFSGVHSAAFLSHSPLSHHAIHLQPLPCPVLLPCWLDEIIRVECRID